MGGSRNTLGEVVNYFQNELEEQFENSELESILHITFSHYFSIERADFILDKDSFFSDVDFETLKRIISELRMNKPLAQIMGEWEFCDFVFKVNENTLVPRPETEELVHLIINENKGNHPVSILDIGTGSGCIAISLKKFMKESEVSAFDISEDALECAKANSELNDTEVNFRKVDILSTIKRSETFDVIVSNPPYITEKEKDLMHENVLKYEPHLALFVKNETPLIFYEAIADYAVNHLNKNGKLYFEINEHFGLEMKEMLLSKKFKNVNIVQDINEKDRIVTCNL